MPFNWSKGQHTVTQAESFCLTSTMIAGSAADGGVNDTRVFLKLAVMKVPCRI